jgi:hypothetical protein
VRVPMAGERLSKSAREILDTEKHAHLSAEQHEHMDRLLSNAAQARLKHARAVARHACAALPEEGGDERVARADGRRSAAAEDLHQHELALAICKRSFGVE